MKNALTNPAVVLVVFDIDNTLINYDVKGSTDPLTGERIYEWTIHPQKLELLCKSLVNFGDRNNVQVAFGISSAKKGIDDRVIAVVKALKNYLKRLDPSDENHQSAIEDNYAYIHHNGDVWKCTLGMPKKGQLHWDIWVPHPHPRSSIQVTGTYAKSGSLRELSSLYGAEPKNTFLVDDSPLVLKEAMDAQFSVISAEGVASANKSQQEIKGISLVRTIRSIIKNRIIELAGNKIATYPAQLTRMGLRRNKASAPRVAECIGEVLKMDENAAHTLLNEYTFWAKQYKPTHIKHPDIAHLQSRFTS